VKEKKRRKLAPFLLAGRREGEKGGEEDWGPSTIGKLLKVSKRGGGEGKKAIHYFLGISGTEKKKKEKTRGPSEKAYDKEKKSASQKKKKRPVLGKKEEGKKRGGKFDCPN